ncbi:hypothetical protein [Infirmifilum sp. SLHALR2]|nr:MAG: hypothetical protein B7L53_09590 [Thermofilum sp. NZ13]
MMLELLMLFGGAVLEAVGLGPLATPLVAYGAWKLAVQLVVPELERVTGFGVPEVVEEAKWRALDVKERKNKKTGRLAGYVRVFGPLASPAELDVLTGWARQKGLLEHLRPDVLWTFLILRENGETRYYVGASCEGELQTCAQAIKLALSGFKRAAESMGMRVEVSDPPKLPLREAPKGWKSWLPSLSVVTALLLVTRRLTLGWSWSGLGLALALVGLLPLILPLGRRVLGDVGVARPKPYSDMSRVTATSTLSYSFEALNWSPYDFFVKVVFRRADADIAKLRELYSRREATSQALFLPGMALEAQHLWRLLQRIDQDQERLFEAVVVYSKSVEPVLRSLGWEPLRAPLAGVATLILL